MKKVVKNWKTKAGLEAWIFLVKNSHHCGYVAAPEFFDGMDFDEVPVNVHGGITYDGHPEWANNNRVVGYDCAHAGDVVFGYQYEGDVWRDVDFCTEQCELLAAQLKALGETK